MHTTRYFMFGSLNTLKCNRRWSIFYSYIYLFILKIVVAKNFLFLVCEESFSFSDLSFDMFQLEKENTPRDAVWQARQLYCFHAGWYKLSRGITESNSNVKAYRVSHIFPSVGQMEVKQSSRGTLVRGHRRRGLVVH